MAPFIRKFTDDSTGQNDSFPHEGKDAYLRLNPSYGAKAVNTEGETFSPYSTVKSENEIRHLSFFKEQEKEFTEPADEEEWEERQSPINFILIIAVLIVTAVAGWFCYRWLNPTQTGQPPIITAEQEILKIRPENPGGMVIPHQDKLVYNRLAPDQQQPVERLLPPPEQPIATPIQETQPYYINPQGQPVYAQQPSYNAQNENNIVQQQQPYPQGYATNQPQQQIQAAPPYQQQPLQQGYAPTQQQLAQSQQQPAPYQPQQAGYAPMPGMQQGQQPYASQAPQVAASTHPIVDNQQQLQQQPQVAALSPQQQNQRALPAPLPPLPSQSLAVKAQQPGQQNSESTTDQKLPVAASSSGEGLDKIGLDNLIAEEATGTPIQNSSAQTAKTKETSPPAATNSGKFRVQVASFTSEKEAVAEANRLKPLDAALFKDKKLQVIKSDSSTSKKPVYRVVVAGFATANQAAQFSNKLRVHKIKGIVLNPTNG